MANQKATARDPGSAGPDAGAMLAAMGDGMRRQIIGQLRAGPRTVMDLAGALPVSRPAVSQHLKVLREAGLVIEMRAGVRHYFALDAVALDVLRLHFEGMWEDVMQAFANYVRESEHGRPANKPGPRG